MSSVSYCPYKSIRVLYWRNSLIACSLGGSSGVSNKSSHLSHHRGVRQVSPIAPPLRPRLLSLVIRIFFCSPRRPFRCVPVTFAQHGPPPKAIPLCPLSRLLTIGPLSKAISLHPSLVIRVSGSSYGLARSPVQVWVGVARRSRAQIWFRVGSAWPGVWFRFGSDLGRPGQESGSDVVQIRL